MTTFVVLPEPPVGIVDRISARGAAVHRIEPLPGPSDALAARVCAAISRLLPEPPLVIVAGNDAAQLLPSVARAQHSAHRRVVAYLLIDPDLPAVSDTWPDAPVTVVSRDEWAMTQVRLRGWELLEAEQLDHWIAAAASHA